MFNCICHQGTFADWIGGEAEALEGFSWRGGSERDTTGILLWSKPYIKTLPSGEEVCSGFCLVEYIVYHLVHAAVHVTLQ